VALIIPSIDLSSPEFQAPNNFPTSLPPATLKAIADAKERGEYLQKVDCYWNPPEADELLGFVKDMRLYSETDFRFRNHSVSRISEYEDKIVNLNQAEKDEKDFTKQCDIRKEISKYTSYINYMKGWKPQRRIVASIETNDHCTDETIKQLMTVSDKYPKLVSKLVKVIEYRKQALAEMNKTRGTPMRKIYVYIVLTPIDFKADCTWTITRLQHNDDIDTYSHYKTHYLHATEYNLQGDEAVEYKSNERLIEEQKEKEKKEQEELRKQAHEGYSFVRVDELNKSNRFSYKQNECVADEHKTDSKLNIYRFIVNNINEEKKTVDLVGYEAFDGKIYKCVVVKTMKGPLCKNFQKTMENRKVEKTYNISALL